LIGVNTQYGSKLGEHVILSDDTIVIDNEVNFDTQELPVPDPFEMEEEIP
jgi:hypothetical protein